MYKIALCDDNQESLRLIEKTLLSYCLRHEFEIDLKSFNSSDVLMEFTEEKKLFDAYFLDVDMPVHSGIELVKQIRNLSDLPVIVLLTGYEQYAIEACGMGIFRYVLKSQWGRKAEKILEEIFIRLRNICHEQVYVISNQRKYVMFRPEEIIYIYKNQKNAVYVLKERGEEKERQTLVKVYEKLNRPEMFFLDRCTIINIQWIQKIQHNEIKLRGGYEIISNEDSIKRLKSYLSGYWRNYI